MKGELPLHSWTSTHNSSLFCKQKGANLPKTQGWESLLSFSKPHLHTHLQICWCSLEKLPQVGLFLRQEVDAS